MRNVMDITGQVFGNWTVIKFHSSSKNKILWLCKCSCGTEKIIIGSTLKSGRSKSCGCLKLPDLSGQVFGNWTVIKREGSLNNKSTWLCKCSCGTEKTVIGHNLKNGISKSCGCKIMTETRKQAYKNRPSNVKIGDVFGRLTIIEKTDKRLNRCKLWLCKCICGKDVLTTSTLLTSGKKRSCGCLILDTARKLMKARIGPLSPCWKKDLTDEDRRNSKNRCLVNNLKLIEWRKSVFTRDNFTCNICGKYGGINAHHKDSWDDHKEKRYDTANGVVLCESCHKKFHMNYGFGHNTEAQYIEFYNKYRKILFKPN